MQYILLQRGGIGGKGFGMLEEKCKTSLNYGEAKMEFMGCLERITELQQKGYYSKAIYRQLVKEELISMSYSAFHHHLSQLPSHVKRGAGPQIALQHVIQVCQNSSRGILRRIDENRELLEALRKEAPDLLKRCGWVEERLVNNDDFFSDLVEAVGVENIFIQRQQMYPKPWPGERI